MKILINIRHGGFGLSDEAFECLIKHKGWVSTEYNEDGDLINPDADIAINKKEDWNWRGKYDFGKLDQYDEDIRIDKDIIEVVEKLGNAANGKYAELKVVIIPDDVKWQIEEYDGAEWIAEEHRTWS